MSEPDTACYFAGKSAVVTGAASGIGLALCETLLSLGGRGVTLFDIKADTLRVEAARLAAAYSGKVIGVVGDVTDRASVEELIRGAADEHDGLDLLFNNAGAAFGGVFEQQSDEDWSRAFALNFYGPLYAIRAALPIMRDQGGGHIVSIVSGIAFAPMAQQSMYAATKAALNALTLALRYEHWDDGVRFSSATPGSTVTAIWGDPAFAPDHAQTPSKAAMAILEGAARNERLVLGDASDLSGATNAFNPTAAEGMDRYLLDVARRRRRGERAV